MQAQLLETHKNIIVRLARSVGAKESDDGHCVDVNPRCASEDRVKGLCASVRWPSTASLLLTYATHAGVGETVTTTLTGVPDTTVLLVRHFVPELLSSTTSSDTTVLLVSHFVPELLSSTTSSDEVPDTTVLLVSHFVPEFLSSTTSSDNVPDTTVLLLVCMTWSCNISEPGSMESHQSDNYITVIPVEYPRSRVYAQPTEYLVEQYRVVKIPVPTRKQESAHPGGNRESKMNSKRKNRPNATRSPRNRGPERTPAAEGIYQNAHYMHGMTCLVGETFQIETVSGTTFEGIFSTYSSSFEVVLEMAHKVNANSPSQIDAETVVEKMIFRPSDIATIKALNTDLQYALRDTFQTDTAISRYSMNGQGSERELEPWEGPGFNGDEFELETNSANGWDVNEMFRKNEQVYGVQSSFQPSLEGYTLQLQKEDTKDYKDAEAKAAKIANEIENNPRYKARIELENGDEEERFAAVVRPSSVPSSQGSTSNVEGGKYVPPAKRRNPQSGKLVRSTPPPQQPLTTSLPLSQGYNSPIQSGGPGSYHPPPPFPQPLPQIPSPTPVTQPPPPPVHNHPPPVSPNYPQQPPLPQREQKVNGMDGKGPIIRQVRYPSDHPLVSQPSMPMSQPVQSPHMVQQPPPPLHTLTQAQLYTSQPHPAELPNIPQPVTRVVQPPPHHTHTHPGVGPPAPFPSGGNSITAQVPLTQTGSGVPPLRKPMPHRGREDNMGELKKFGQDFKLEGELAENKNIPVQHQHHLKQHVQEEHIQQQIQPEDLTNTPSSDNVDKVTNTLKKSTLNPNAKEFVYNPNAKPFTPRSASTPTPSRPHTPQTPQYPSMPTMVMPTYVVATTQPTFTPSNQGPRFRKVQMAPMPHRPDIASQMQVAAATGQPLLAPAPMHTPFTVPYNPQGHMQAQPIPADGPHGRPARRRDGPHGLPSGLSRASTTSHSSDAIHVPSESPPRSPSPRPSTSTAGGNYHHHHPHPQSPAGVPPSGYQQPPPPAPQHTFPLMCGPLVPAQHPHHMLPQQQVQYIHQHQVGNSQHHHVQVILHNHQ
uniref:(California timema) hypothetical protein n=1 Tax=Timema californicum TaxID=61474 RepID=A0A7R9JEN3_TIMCA|nr:unnamed protein product [Timema californicum]